MYGTNMADITRILQHELTHALYAAAFGKLTYSWYAEGMAAFFEYWDIGLSEAENIAARPRSWPAIRTSATRPRSIRSLTCKISGRPSGTRIAPTATRLLRPSWTPHA